MTLIIAHRGGGSCKDGWPENSVAAFRRCVGLGVDGIECDLQLSGDRKVVVMHDPQLQRMTGAAGVVAEHSTAALSRLPLQGTPHGIPLLDDVLHILAATTFELHLELKTDHRAEPYPGMAAIVLERLAEYGIPEDRTVFTSFQPALLAEVRALRPTCRVEAAISLSSAGMLGGLRSTIAVFERLDGCLLSIAEPLLSANWRDCQAIGLERIGVWTVNDPADIRLWIDRGLRHVITDRPGLALRIRAGGAAGG